MERITRLLDKNLSQLRYEETVTRGYFWPLSCPSTILGYSCYSCAICGIIHGLLYLYSLQVWIFANWNNFGRYRCCNAIFVTFANFAKLAEHKRFLFTFILLLNLLFLRHLLAFFFLWPFLFVNVEFCKICYSCYFCDIYYSVFSHSKKKSSVVTFAIFAKFIYGLHEAILDLFSF